MTARPASVGQSRRGARIAAVQALYQMEINNGAPEDVIVEFATHRFRGVEPRIVPGDVDVHLFADIVRGVAAKAETIDHLVAGALDKSRGIGRLEVLLRVMLRAGAYELSARPDIDAALTIKEYTAVADAFFAEREPALVNAVLDRIARQVGKAPRSAEPDDDVPQDR